MAQGGAGGWGNAHYVSPTNQEPVLSQRGERGEYVVLFLELKLLADVGLLARPNAGKSTPDFPLFCSQTPDCRLPVYNGGAGAGRGNDSRGRTS